MGKITVLELDNNSFIKKIKGIDQALERLRIGSVSSRNPTEDIYWHMKFMYNTDEHRKVSSRSFDFGRDPDFAKLGPSNLHYDAEVNLP